MTQDDGRTYEEKQERRLQQLCARFANRDQPFWVNSFRGPFEDPTCDRSAAIRQYVKGENKPCLLSWCKQYMEGQASNIVVPILRWDSGRREVDYCVLVGDLEDAERLAQENPAKDAGQFMLPARGVAVEPDPALWREMRSHFASGFLPRNSLAPGMPVLLQGTEKLLDRWGRMGSVELRDELHHFALDMFMRAMLGIHDLLPSTPTESARVRAAFNLEALTLEPKAFAELITQAVGFSQQVLQHPTATAPLLELTRSIQTETYRVSHMTIFLVAGHDTTAHTLEWVLLELARHPEVQDALCVEAEAVHAELMADARDFTFEDLARLRLTTAVITETLRLWGPAFSVFARKLSKDTTLRGRNGPVIVPEGTCINFWFFGHHHSPMLWGADASEWCPLTRCFSDEELQVGTFRTPSSKRYHPFSLPSRDCLGKNFSLMEQRLFISQLVRRFRIEIDEPWLSRVAELRSGHGKVFQQLAAVPGTIKPPQGLTLKFVPRVATATPSRL